MANKKKKSDIKNSNTKKNNSVNLNKKVSTTKKKLVVPDEVKKKLKETESVKKTTKKKTIEVNNEITEKKTLTPEEIALQKKERNRKKYEKVQRKYQDTKKIRPIKKTEVLEEIKEEKKKIDIPDEVKSKKKVVKEEELVKRTNVNAKTISKEKERKEKRKFNQINFTQTLTTLKKLSTTKIDIFKEKTNDNNIPVGKSEEDKKKRFSRVVRESIIYGVILTIFNIICILVFDYFNFLRLFDVKALNVVITIIISLIFNFFIAFMIDHFVTEIWLNKKSKKKVDDIDGNNRFNKRKHRENIKDKEGK